MLPSVTLKALTASNSSFSPQVTMINQNPDRSSCKMPGKFRSKEPGFADGLRALIPLGVSEGICVDSGHQL